MPVSTALADEANLTAAEVEFFEKQVRPILVEHCYECHGDEGDGGLSLESRSGLLQGGDTGPAIVPGDVDASLLIEAVRYENLDLQMPPKNRLDAKLIATLERWIEQGAPDPRTETTHTVSPTGMEIDDGREFWSFQPVADPPVPTVNDQSWVQTPIDAFILSRLESQGLTPAPQADRQTLIRRLTFNLTGLPPTTEEVETFVADTSPDAVKSLVDRLLMSPQYGVRWGRHWLDVARYADSNGLDENLAFGNAWRYRDYVVDAFNNDKPFDRFLIEQIAGDLLPEANRDTKIATGFLVLGAKVLAEPDREKLEMDTIDEQLDSTGKAFLGMTFGCVRCHDHKFDPIKQSDYYALAAIFKSTRTFGDAQTGAIKHWHEDVFATDEELKAIKVVDSEIAALKSAAAKFKSAETVKLQQLAKTKAADYLVAATRFNPDASLNEIKKIASEYDLHPRILHHCRMHLKYHANDPVFEPWYRVQAGLESEAERADAVDSHYRTLFAQVDEALVALRKKDPKAKTLESAEFEAAHAAIDDKFGFLAVPPKPEFAFDAETLAEYDRKMEAARLRETRAIDVPSAMGVIDREVLTSLPIHIRGSHRNLGKPVAREFPEVMRLSEVRPVFPRNQSGRLELARWMANSRHPLTARVYVNRIWRWHFGAGLVRSTENFGVLGDPPSHPELLDWLARRFMASGWSTKELHRLILSSNVYQMAAAHPEQEAADSIDPENRLWWKFHLQRLEPEQLRDSILVVAGRLDRQIGGKTVPLRNRQFVFNHTSVDHTRYDSLRRATYLPVIRNNLYTLFAQFDFPDPTMPTGNRHATTVAPQALLLMNSDLVMDSSDALADELLGVSLSDSSRIEMAYQKVLGRQPTQVESNRVLAFVDRVAASARTNSESVDLDAMRRAWSLFCQSLFASNEFMYLR